MCLLESKKTKADYASRQHPSISGAPSLQIQTIDVDPMGETMPTINVANMTTRNVSKFNQTQMNETSWVPFKGSLTVNQSPANTTTINDPTAPPGKSGFFPSLIN